MVFACGCICTKNIPPAPRPASRLQNRHTRRGCVRQAYKTTKKTAQTGPAAPSFHKTIHHIVAYLGPLVNLLCDFCAQKCIFWRGLRQNSAFYQSKAAARAKSVLVWRTAPPGTRPGGPQARILRPKKSPAGRRPPPKPPTHRAAGPAKRLAGPAAKNISGRRHNILYQAGPVPPRAPPGA